MENFDFFFFFAKYYDLKIKVFSKINTMEHSQPDYSIIAKGPVVLSIWH